jgi:hypothetical protein
VAIQAFPHGESLVGKAFPAGEEPPPVGPLEVDLAASAAAVVPGHALAHGGDGSVRTTAGRSTTRSTRTPANPNSNVGSLLKLVASSTELSRQQPVFRCHEPLPRRHRPRVAPEQDRRAPLLQAKSQTIACAKGCELQLELHGRRPQQREDHVVVAAPVVKVARFEDRPMGWE